MRWILGSIWQINTNHRGLFYETLTAPELRCFSFGLSKVTLLIKKLDKFLSFSCRKAISLSVPCLAESGWMYTTASPTTTKRISSYDDDDARIMGSYCSQLRRSPCVHPSIVIFSFFWKLCSFQTTRCHGCQCGTTCTSR